MQKKIAYVRVLGQKRPVQICAYNTTVEDAFTGVFSVVAMTIQDLAERRVAADISPASVVFKADDLIRK